MDESTKCALPGGQSDGHSEGGGGRDGVKGKPVRGRQISLVEERRGLRGGLQSGLKGTMYAHYC